MTAAAVAGGVETCSLPTEAPAPFLRLIAAAATAVFLLLSVIPALRAAPLLSLVFTAVLQGLSMLLLWVAATLLLLTTFSTSALLVLEVEPLEEVALLLGGLLSADSCAEGAAAAWLLLRRDAVTRSTKL
jgi:hypothetical protein